VRDEAEAAAKANPSSQIVAQYLMVM